MEYFDSVITLILVFAVGLISPGPDFALIVKNSLIYSRRIAVCTALGIALGATTHSAYILFGLGGLITSNPKLLNILTITGALYLMYLGYGGVKSQAKNRLEDFTHLPRISLLSAISSGYMTCLLNPKAILFLTSILTTLSPLNTPKTLLFLFGITVFLETFIWYSFVAVFLSAKKIRAKLCRMEHWVNRVTGLILLLIGLMLIIEVVREELYVR